MLPLRGLALWSLLALPALAGEAQSFERRLQVLDGLSRAANSQLTCHKLGVLSQAVPPNAVLSRLAFDGATNSWDLSLSKGTQADAQAMLGALTKAKLCGPVTLKADGSATCTVASKRVPLQPAPTKPTDPSKDQLRSLEERLPASVTLDAQRLLLADVASRNELRDVVLEPLKTSALSPALEEVTVSVKGRASFTGAAGFVCEGPGGFRPARLQSLVLSSPRVKNGTWELDVQYSAVEYRLHPDVADALDKLTFLESEAPKVESTTDVVRARSPFGSPAALFAGSTRVVFPDECAEASSVTEAPQRGDPELDLWSVVFSKLSRDAAKSCVMVTDAAGHCHVLRRNSRFGRLKVTSLTPEELRFATFDAARDSKPVLREISMKVASPYAPPAWFCN